MLAWTHIEKTVWQSLGNVLHPDTLIACFFLPQKWVRPAPETDEARDASSHPGECMDFNEADPLLLVENVSQTVVAPRRRGVA